MILCRKRGIQMDLFGLARRRSLGVFLCSSILLSGAANASRVSGHETAIVGSSAAFFQCSAPGYNYFEQMMIRQARFAPEWDGYSYFYESLRDRYLNGDVCSGYYSVRWNYTYSGGGGRINGWVEFRFRNGNLDCLSYSTTPGMCRPPS